MKKYTISELAVFLKAELYQPQQFQDIAPIDSSSLASIQNNNEQCFITGIAPLDKAGPNQISFLEHARYKKYLATTQATALILRKSDFLNEDNQLNCEVASKNILFVSDPYLAYAKLTALFTNESTSPPGIHPTVILGENCSIDSTASIGPYCVLGSNVKIAAGTTLLAHCFVGDNVEIDINTKLNARVTLYHDVKIGKRVLIHSGAVLGADGFGMANEKGKWVKIHQLGAVAIGDDVEIGANTTIDRGALENTIIENGVKLDNQIQIGHNTRIGANTAIAGCTGIAGSTVIGRNCLIGGGAGINGHIEIADGVIVTAMAGVEKSLTKPGIYSSVIPATPHTAWWRIIARLMQLDNLAKKIQQLEKKMQKE